MGFTVTLENPHRFLHPQHNNEENTTVLPQKHPSSFEAYLKDNEIWTLTRMGANFTARDHVLLLTLFSSILWQLQVSPGIDYTSLLQTTAATFQTEHHPKSSTSNFSVLPPPAF